MYLLLLLLLRTERVRKQLGSYRLAKFAALSLSQE
jgi:hypothetical protein